MTKKTSSTATAEHAFEVHGTVRDQYHQPLAKATVKAYSQSLRGKHLLGETVTDASGQYTISCTLKKTTTAGVFVCIYENGKTVLKESEVYYKVPALLQIDLSLGDTPFAGLSECEQLLQTITPFTDDLALYEITETAEEKDISFIVQKTDVQRERIEILAMAARFEKYTAVDVKIWYGILRQGVPHTKPGAVRLLTVTDDFETSLQTAFDALMHTPVVQLMDRLQKSVTGNIIGAAVTKELPEIQKQLTEQQLAYAKKHPVTGDPSSLHRLGAIAGLKGKALDAFVELHNNHTDTGETVWQAAGKHTALTGNKNIEQARTVYNLSRLVHNNLPLTEKLITGNKITTDADIKKLSAYDHSNWETLLKEHKIELNGEATGRDKAEKIKNYASLLERSFTHAYPTASFAARLQKDPKNKWTHREKISDFLQKNEHFDLLNNHVETFLNENKETVAATDKPVLADELRRVQRVFKLAPTYDTTNVLLNDNIHSAHQIAKMGEDNFVNAYSDKLGKAEATRIFQQADAVHANAVALIGNLKSMTDTASIKALSGLSKPLVTQLTPVIPSLDTLFGHADFCDCDECTTVYGAPAYLTDILHFLEQRLTTLDLIGDRRPRVKELLLRRRPDIADLDLECDNANTEIPYIDIACELMEDFISPPSISLPAANFSLLAPGVINTTLLNAIRNQFNTTGQTSIGAALTAAAKVSASYTVNHLQSDNTYLTLTHWVIRDTQVILRASGANATSPVECRLLHQTLLPADAISAGPEYVNQLVYSNALKTAKMPFSLPFDLYETESELYLEKLGAKKADLIDTFSRTGPSPLHSTADVNMGYASLDINQAEQTLIFTPDTAHQTLYWGSDATSTAIAINTFEKLSGLTYAEIVSLIQLQFINPAKDSVIDHDDLSANTSTQRITNITSTKLDAIHRFLRLWRKTTLTMQELDAFIVNMSIQNGLSNPTLNAVLADQLRNFLSLQQSLELGAFELLAFYGDLDTTHNLPDCLYNLVYQNSAVTNPVNPNFSPGAIQTQTLTLGDPDKLVICSILRISLAELNATLSQTGTAAVVTVRTLTILYRHAKLAQALGVSLTELLTLLRLINTNPFADPAATSRFIRSYQQMQAFGFSTEEVNYILRHYDNADHTLVPTTDQRSTALNQLQTDLLNIKAVTASAADPNGVLLTQWLTNALLKWDSSLVNRLIDILSTTDDDTYKQKLTDNASFLFNLRLSYQDAVLKTDLSALPVVAGAPIVIPASLATQLSFDATNRQLVLKGVISTADRDALLALSNDATYQAAINALYNRITTSSAAGNSFFTSLSDVGAQLNNLLSDHIPDRFAFFINKLAPVYRSLLNQDALVKNISTWFNIDNKLGSVVVQYVPEVFNELTADNFINKVIDTTTAGNPYPVQANRYQYLAKLFFVLRKMNLSVLAQDQALQLFLTTGPTVGIMDFKSLPLTLAGGSVNTFPGFEALLNFLRFDQLYPTRLIPFSTGGQGRYNIFGIMIQLYGLPGDIPGALTQLKNNLAFAYGWNATDLQTLLSANFTVLADFTAASSIMLRLHQSFTTLQQLGVSLADAQSWCGFSPTVSDSTKIKNALKTKCSASDWLQVTQPLQNTLREKKRDALIAYLLANPGSQSWKDTNDLYSYFLLDVEMCSCQPTSRIVQATNSVQLFVQRCFLGLEQSVIVNTKKDNNNAKKDAGWLQWDWMKNFRVWQANVKVFLYPENWIEPELLPDEIKSPFLKDLENDLLQNEVNAINAEDAFKRYLEQLSSVARLEIKGMWYDQATKTLHVFGRTFGGDPKIYYHRQLINDKRWTPWVKVDADITGDHILPAMYNNRLYLFWAVITEIADSVQKFDVPHADQPGVTIKPPAKQWQIQMAFSEYKNGKWTPKVISKNDATGQIVIPQIPIDAAFRGATLNKENFCFVALDIPDYDYSKIFVDNTKPDPKNGHLLDQIAFNLKAADSVSVNGKLLISCYFYLFSQNDSYDNNIYVGSFQLDPVKGYPVQLTAKSQVLLHQAPHYPERTNRHSSMFNMLDAETFPGTTPPTNGIPGSGSGGVLVGEQAGGPFSNLIPLQMDIGDRFTYMNNIYGLKDLTTFALKSILGTNLPYFYQDQRRTYYIVPENTDNGAVEYLYSYVLDGTMILLEKGQAAFLDYLNKMPANVRYRYFNFFHPLVDYFIQQLYTGSISGLMDRDTQLKGDFGYDPDADKLFNFENYFQPVINGFSTIYSGGALPPVTRNGKPDNTPGYPKDNVDFNLQSGYGMYNWELFFHAPLMIAERLSQNQQFEDADRWYKYIFNPMDSSTYEAPAKYWITQPFFLNVSSDYNDQRIDNLLNNVNTGSFNNNFPTLIADVADWRDNPFQPHFIAQYRTVAYQKAVVMKYVAHLIRHGDFLFTQQTMESVNEATQLYILAAEILGPKPELIAPPVTTGVDNYYQLEQKLDVLSDALVDVENLIPQHTIHGSTGTTTGAGVPLKTLYFNIPMNENLVGAAGYWDTVADRLFKIRHCLSIDGTFAPLSLFAPAIDPGMLVRAAAAGLNIGSILNDINAPLPLYRFMTMLQKAAELCNDVKSLGASLLSALEKKDAESLSLLRSGHEIKLQSAVLGIKQKQIEEAQSAIDNIGKQKELTTIRQKYYTGLLKNGLNDGEEQALFLNKTSLLLEAGIAVGYTLSGGLKLIPKFLIGISGFGGSPHATAEAPSFGDSAEDFVKTITSIATAADKLASVIGTQAGYDRRSEEWQFQLNLANKELEQLDKQLLGAQIRLNIANQDLANQQLQIDQSMQSDDLMRNKFTNEALFNWMITQVSNTYFKSYQLAYDLAKKAERCFRYELALDDSAYINFGYWDNLKKGLLAGEQLGYDIKKMEMAYYEQNKRELELTKHISLSQLDPVALLKLKTTGECWVNLPEELFDMDYPGHYMRRIKSVSITIPCITGPYTTVSCKLTMTRNSIRTSGVSTTDATQYPRRTTHDVPADDPRFRDAVGVLQSIATSSAQNDSGLFELNFRDERYLPFEGAGVISLWHIQLPAAIRQFDYNTISDAIIHLKYTARDGGDALSANAANNLVAKINSMIDPKQGKGLMRIFSAKNDLPTEWYRFLHPVTPGGDQVLTLNLDESRFPLFVQGKHIKIKSMELVADTAGKPINNLHYTPAGATDVISFTKTGAYYDWVSVTIDYSGSKKDPGTWTITNPASNNSRLTDSNPQNADILVKNMAIIVYYEIS